MVCADSLVGNRFVSAVWPGTEDAGVALLEAVGNLHACFGR